MSIGSSDSQQQGPGEVQFQHRSLPLQCGDQCRSCHAGWVAECPAIGLWIAEIKVHEEGRVREVPEVRAVISHGIGEAWNVIVGHGVMMVWLVQCMQVQEVGGSLSGDYQSPLQPVDGSHVVIDQGIGCFGCVGVAGGLSSVG